MILRASSVAFGVVLATLLGFAKSSRAQPAKPPLAPLAMSSSVRWHPTTAWPETLAYENRYYDVNVTGLRNYLDSIRASSPDVYARLDPGLSRLESRRTIATGVFVGGAVAAVASIIYAFVPTQDCVPPSPGDPQFGAGSDAFAQCGRDRQTRMATFGLLGLGAFGAGFLGAWAISPSRSDLLAFVSEHNQVNPTPLRLHIGFDPSRRSAFAGAQFSF